MALLAATNDLSLVVNISNVSALFYYALSSASAVRLKAGRRMAVVSAAGVALCLFLLLFLTPQSIILTLGIMCAGLGHFLLKLLTGRDNGAGAQMAIQADSFYTRYGDEGATRGWKQQVFHIKNVKADKQPI